MGGTGSSVAVASSTEITAGRAQPPSLGQRPAVVRSTILRAWLQCGIRPRLPCRASMAGDLPYLTWAPSSAEDTVPPQRKLWGGNKVMCVTRGHPEQKKASIFSQLASSLSLTRHRALFQVLTANLCGTRHSRSDSGSRPWQRLTEGGKLIRNIILQMGTPHRGSAGGRGLHKVTDTAGGDRAED